MASYHSLNDLHAFIADVLTALGVPAGDADTTARRMLEADVRGMAAHGIFRLPQYVKRIEAGGYNLHPDIRAVRETPVSALIDGDNGLGQVVVTQATERAIAKAREHGLGWVGVRGSNHAGAAGVYASMGLEYDLIGVYLAVGSSNHLPAWGGLDPLLSIVITAPVMTLLTTTAAVFTAPLTTHGDTMVQIPSTGTSHDRPCVRPNAEAKPSARSATATPMTRLLIVIVDMLLKPTTHGEIAR